MQQVLSAARACLQPVLTEDSRRLAAADRAQRDDYILSAGASLLRPTAIANSSGQCKKLQRSAIVSDNRSDHDLDIKKLPRSLVECHSKLRIISYKAARDANVRAAVVWRK